MSQELVASVAAVSSPAEEPTHLSHAYALHLPELLGGGGMCVPFKEILMFLNLICQPILNTSSLYQQGFVVQFIREIPESTGHAGALSFLVSSIITFTVNMSLSSGWEGGGGSMLSLSRPYGDAEYIDTFWMFTIL